MTERDVYRMKEEGRERRGGGDVQNEGGDGGGGKE
jgi:hypothetical protein